MIVIVVLHRTLNPITQQERVKINENWDAIENNFSRLRSIINVLSGGGDFELVIEEIDKAIADARSVVVEGETLFTEISQELSNLTSVVNDAITATNSANTSAQLADFAATNANNATSSAVSATNDANLAATNADLATQNTNAAIENARVQTLNAETQANYAKEQGDIAAGLIEDLEGISVVQYNERLTEVERANERQLQPLAKRFLADTLQSGNLMGGYYGKVKNLITGNELFVMTGLTVGNTVNSGDITWLKFSYNYKTLLIADRDLKQSISWDDIQAQNLVKGKVIEIAGQKYLCRLMTGGDSNPASTSGGEWSDLIEIFTPSDEDSHWNDVRTFTQEISDSNITYRVTRGFDSVSGFSKSTTAGSASANFGWRPVLELL